MISLCDDNNWQVTSDTEGLLFRFPDESPLKPSSRLSKDPLTIERGTILRMISEQVGALDIKNGMRLDWEIVCELNPALRESLQLPPKWFGGLKLGLQGLTKNDDFDINLKVTSPDGSQLEGVTLEGGIIKIGLDQYLADSLQYEALKTIADFKNQKSHERSQYSSLTTIEKLQSLSARGLEIDLNAFNEIKIVKPNAVRVALEENEDGSIKISPDLCKTDKTKQGATSVVAPQLLDTRLDNYLVKESTTCCLPAGKVMHLLDEKTVTGIREITRNPYIPKERVADFIENPSAWLNAEFVDLDLGFSERVKGLAPLRLAYFGETDESGIQWIEPKESATEPSDSTKDGNNDGDDDEQDADDLDESDQEPFVLDIELDDEGEAPDSLRNVRVPLHEDHWDEALDFEQYKRTPYSYQATAIRWLLGLSIGAKKDHRWSGGLLADDMGLGKTFTVLVFLREYLARSGSSEPALITAPVSLLEVWKEEIEETFKDSPFSEIILLHSSGDLKRFKIIDESELEANDPLYNSNGKNSNKVRYALRVSSDKGTANLDTLGRANSLIITNYETIRDYQYSLARIPWSLAIFDEAQAIKNPNTRVTRAVKALKSEFTVVMTGTPVENSLKDFWCLMDRVQRGFLDHYQPFRKKYIAPIVAATKGSNPENSLKIRDEIGSQLRKKVGGFMLRRLKSDHLDGLPKKEIILHEEFGNPSSGYDTRISCEMAPEQLNIYEQVANLKPGLDLDNSNDIVIKAILNLKLASLHPDLVKYGKLRLPTSKKEAEKSLEKSGKLQKVIGILETIRSKKEKVLIFAISKEVQKFLQTALRLYFDLQESPPIINGDTKVKKSANRKDSSSRKELIDRFQEESGFGIMILSPIAAGVGLTITKPNHVIHLERHWNPAKEAQATDRVYRIGQKLPVSVWIPILLHPSHESFDEKLDKLLTRKLGLSDSVITPESVSPSDLGNLINGNSTPSSESYDFKDIDRLDPFHFEAMVALMIQKNGADRVILTRRGSDKGCDIAVLGWNEQNWIIQCKHKENPRSHRFGGAAVREAVGSRNYYEEKLGQQFQKLAVFSNIIRYDQAAKEAARIDDARLFRRRDLKKLFPRDGIKIAELKVRLSQTEKI